ncbi:MAG: hypothetical protein U9R72_02455 [Chloroflexota bacterium]|nr:hypothetical protein [Chloroflexota bacterium]
MTHPRDPDPAIRDLTTQLGDVLIRRHNTETWRYWIIHVLEILDNHLESRATGLGDDILVRPLREDLDVRLKYHEW